MPIILCLSSANLQPRYLQLCDPAAANVLRGIHDVQCMQMSDTLHQYVQIGCADLLQESREICCLNLKVQHCVAWEVRVSAVQHFWHCINIAIVEYSGRIAFVGSPRLKTSGAEHVCIPAACREGNTALHLACQSNQLKAIEVLLQWGARASMTNASGFAPVSPPSLTPTIIT